MAEHGVATSGVEKEITRLVADIETGTDSFEVPEELLLDAPDQDPAREQNLRVKIAGMSVGERLKLALRGGREARAVLIRDPTLLVQRFVLQNPRITDEELIAVAKNRSVEHEVLEIICKKKEWVANYQIRLALVENPKTPLPIALRYVPTLRKRDLRMIAKSKNVPSAVNGMAKRIVLTREG
jgi:hypothetical protein